MSTVSVARCTAAPVRVPAAFSADLERLYHTHAGACRGLARRMLGDSERAEEVVQEAFLAAWLHADRYDPALSSPCSWLLLLTYRKTVDRCRRDARHPHVPLDGVGEIPDPLRGPEQTVLAAMLAPAVRDALLALPLAQRQALVLAYWGGYTQREIADRTGAPLGTVKSRIVRGLLGLRSLLADR